MGEMGSLDQNVIVQSAPFLWEGMKTSFLLLVLAMAGGIVLGTAIAVVRLLAPQPIAVIAAGYVNGLRSLPLIMVIFWFYFLMPLVVGRPVGAFASALIAFVLFEAAYYSEIIRAGIQGISKGQVSAATASGMTQLQVYCYVVLPQAFQRMIPILLTQGIVLFQDTSLVYVVGLHDFMTAVTVIANREAALVELYVFAAIIYFAISFSASRAVSLLRQRTAATRERQ
ncbi:glutamate/aspartate transport system permease protein [Mesorhizobium robiniae]|uniref:Glutamate/aspartate transport system permease protein n=1 Tax=Mesorhizobium robiniae TaxID=559315 RepID=A0ABV2GNN7_9HYPH